MEIYTIAFFGHRTIGGNPLRLEKLLDAYIRNLLSGHEYVEFLVGRNGEFDRYAASAVLRCRRKYRDDNSSLILVLPYETAEYRDNRDSFEQYYDGITVSLAASIAHPRSAIQIRNREMVDRADLILCCIERKSGGAWRAVQYAVTRGKRIHNLAD